MQPHFNEISIIVCFFSFCQQLLGFDQQEELVVADTSVVIKICFSQHRVDLPVRHVDLQTAQNSPELLRCDEAVAVLVEEVERFLDVVFKRDRLHPVAHHDDELVELDGAVPIGVGFADDVDDFGVRRVLSEGPDHFSEFLDGDGPVSVRVEQREGILDSRHLRFG
jgi:hypothetical protein